MIVKSGVERFLQRGPLIHQVSFSGWIFTGWLATAAAMSHFFAAMQRTTRVPKDLVAVLVLRRNLFKYQRRRIEHS
jgi:hypothetical protein